MDLLKLLKKSFRLKLPSHFKIHNVFHVSLLKPYIDDARNSPPPLPVIVDGHEEYIPMKILKSNKKGTRFLVQWEGFPIEQATWDPRHHLSKVPELIEEFYSRVDS